VDENKHGIKEKLKEIRKKRMKNKKWRQTIFTDDKQLYGSHVLTFQCLSRCTARTFICLYVARLGAPYVHESI
jgi:hypothetical protein